MPNYKILWFDPGGTTGYAIFTRFIEDAWTITSGQLVGEDHHELIRHYIQINHPDVVGTEAFEFRQNARGKNERRGLNLISREYIGVMKLICKDNEIPLVQQTANYKDLNLVRDQNLDALGILSHPPTNPENVHQNDAKKHLLHYLIKQYQFQPIIDALKEARDARRAV